MPLTLADLDALQGHVQCRHCGRIMTGPAAEYPYKVSQPRYPMPTPEMGMNVPDELKDAMLHHVDEEGHTYSYKEARERGLPGNVSTATCLDCDPVVRNREGALQGRRDMNRAVKRMHAETEDSSKQAHEPIAEAHEPIPEAHTPVPDAHQPVEQPAADSQE